MRKIPLVLVAVTAITLGACTTTPGQKEIGGTLLGAAGGALIGSFIGGGAGQIVAVAIGTLVGAHLGREAGVSLDRADRQELALDAELSVFRALKEPVGTSIIVAGSNNNGSDRVTTTRVVREESFGDGGVCKTMHTHTVFEGPAGVTTGVTQTVEFTACRVPGGAWQID